MGIVAPSELASGFLINTYRKDKKLCMCMSAHTVTNSLQRLNISKSEGSVIPIDIYMQYLGKAVHIPGEDFFYTEIVSGYKSTLQVQVAVIIHNDTASPIVIGLMIFGYYAVKGEYDKLPESSEELV